MRVLDLKMGQRFITTYLPGRTFTVSGPVEQIGGVAHVPIAEEGNRPIVLMASDEVTLVATSD